MSLRRTASQLRAGRHREGVTAATSCQVPASRRTPRLQCPAHSRIGSDEQPAFVLECGLTEPLLPLIRPERPPRPEAGFVVVPGLHWPPNGSDEQPATGRTLAGGQFPPFGSDEHPASGRMPVSQFQARTRGANACCTTLPDVWLSPSEWAEARAGATRAAMSTATAIRKRERFIGLLLPGAAAAPAWMAGGAPS